MFTTYVNFKSRYLTYNYINTITLNKAEIMLLNSYVKWIDSRNSV